MPVKLYLFILSVIVFSSICVTSFGDTSTDVQKAEYRKFNEASLDKYLLDNDFFYLENQKPKTNYLDELKRWFYKMLSSILGSTASGLILGNIHYILMAIALFLIVYKISGLSLEKLGYKVKKVNHFESDFDAVPIEEIDFQSLIKEALNKKDFRLAIRYQYLDVLKSLSEKGLISHSHYKSNVEYAYELKNKTLKNEFRQLVFAFDHIWYGEYTVDANQYQLIYREFDSFKKNIPENIKDLGKK